jgi:hypothetical protein
VRHLRYQRAETFRFSLPPVPVCAQVLYPLDVGKQEFLHFARFVFLSTQVLDLDAQQCYFPLIGTGSDASGGSGAGDVRMKG